MIHIDRSNADKFEVSLLLQRGVYVSKPDTPSVSGFICRLFGMTPGDIQEEIKTIIVDNQIVDDAEAIRLHGGSCLVLSGAMPGLVGAMLRSNSPYKAMRATISASGHNERSGKELSLVCIKLFNTVLAKHRQHMVDNGFWIDT